MTNTNQKSFLSQLKSHIGLLVSITSCLGLLIGGISWLNRMDSTNQAQDKSIIKLEATVDGMGNDITELKTEIRGLRTDIHWIKEFLTIHLKREVYNEPK